MKALSVIKHGISQEHCDTEIYGNYGDYVKEYDPKIFDDRFVISLGYYDNNSREAVRKLQIAQAFPEDVAVIMDSNVYDCPYTKYTHYGIIPVAILTDSPDVYANTLPGWLRDAVSDKSWNAPKCNVNRHRELTIDYLSHINNILLGSGYTIGTIISDGSAETQPFVLDLSNGDNILCFGKVWYNK